MGQATEAKPAAETRLAAAGVQSVQPGGGVCYQVELAWGRVRRALLKTFRKSYLRRMEACRLGSVAGAPWEILDPRDLKYARNQCTADWRPEDDPFRWRDRLPFARWGLAELQLMGWPLLAATIAARFLPTPWIGLVVVPAVILFLVVYFFRDPPRDVPQEAGAVVSPADGKIVEIQPLEHDEFIGGPAVRIGIFLSIFNVHLNRTPVRCRVVELAYHPGLFLNALNPESTLRNEAMWIGLESVEAPGYRLWVRQIAGLFARRIVCNLRIGEELPRGHRFGMIKLGSRTEMVLPADPRCEVTLKIGQKVQAGSTVMARWQLDPQ